MKKIRIGINGFGRIGRVAARIILKRKDLQLAAINSRATSSSHAYLLQYDSTYGKLNLPVKAEKDLLTVEDDKISVLNYPVPAEIPWKRHNIDIVIDATGKFRTTDELKGHLKAGAGYVILSAPAKDDTKTLVMGVNHRDFNPQNDLILSNSSCTTNCLSAVIKVLIKNFQVNRAFMTTVHALTDSQNMLDNSNKSVRLRRSAVASIIPAATGSARDIVKLFPELSGRIICRALRVPVSTVSLINLTAQVNKKVTVSEVNSAFLSASESYLKNILSYSSAELVSVDYKAAPFSATYDHFLTDIIDGRLINLCAWYDNEWGYCERLADLCQYIGTGI